MVCEFGPVYFTYHFVLSRDFSLFLWELKVAPHVAFRMVLSVDFELLRCNVSSCRRWRSHCSGIENRH